MQVGAHLHTCTHLTFTGELIHPVLVWGCPSWLKKLFINVSVCVCKCKHKRCPENIHETFPMAITTLAYTDTWTHHSEAPQLSTFMVRDTNKTLHSAGESDDGLKILKRESKRRAVHLGMQQRDSVLTAVQKHICCWSWKSLLKCLWSGDRCVVCLSPTASRRDECGKISLMCHSLSYYNSRPYSTRIQIQCHSDAVMFGVYFTGKISWHIPFHVII